MSVVPGVPDTALPVVADNPSQLADAVAFHVMPSVLALLTVSVEGALVDPAAVKRLIVPGESVIFGDVTTNTSPACAPAAAVPSGALTTMSRAPSPVSS